MSGFDELYLNVGDFKPKAYNDMITKNCPSKSKPVVWDKFNKCSDNVPRSQPVKESPRLKTLPMLPVSKPNVVLTITNEQILLFLFILVIVNIILTIHTSRTVMAMHNMTKIVN